ncbi:MAG TPA: Hsp20/alpha crystallin family protein [Ramlibacter sp.]|nr:Hsp20/alpha crystallin family protein [Ramlibacter sp.]
MNGMFRSSADLFAELNRMQSLLDQVFPTARSSIRSRGGSGFPSVNVGTTPESVEVMALAPGLDPSSLEITIDRGLLVIAGERKSDLPEGERASVYANERFSGKFRRVVSLPEDADPARVQANYRDGVLRITVHKRESSLPRRIEVN